MIPSYFYPRPPRGGRHRPQCRGAGPGAHFYPRPPRGGRPQFDEVNAFFIAFLSTPSARRAILISYDYTCSIEFLSTPSARRATRQTVWRDIKRAISIHALREEGDRGRAPLFASLPHFYPRPPRGGRQTAQKYGDIIEMISIHALREEGDGGNQHGCLDERISIHALREEGDVSGPVLVSTS